MLLTQVVVIKYLITLLSISFLIENLNSFPHKYHTDAYPNQLWECHNCDGISNNLIFGYVRRAIINEYRDIYLNFDHSWLDIALLKDRKVVVTNVDRNRLPLFNENSLNLSAPSDFNKETFYAVISLGNNKEKLSFPLANEIDTFLFNNPCWIPLHDPPVIKSLNSKNINQNTNYILVQDNNNKQYHSNDYYRSAIFIRLPYFSFGATCYLFNYISNVQSPSLCPNPITNSSAYYSHWLGGIGWSNCLGPLVENFRHAVKNDRIFINPHS